MPSDPDPSQSPSPDDYSHPIAQEPSPIAALGRWIKDTLSGKPEHSLKEALEEVLDEHHESDAPVNVEEFNLLRNMIAFGELTVSDVMIPRTDIFAVPESISLADMKAHISQKRHTRIPIYADSLDNVIGFLHIKDFLMCLTSDCAFDIQQLKRDILFVPASMKITDLLMKMRLFSCHMAIVVDEYGGTDGLVTMEDLFEEIVGDIQDEHDEDEVQPEMNRVSDKVVEADGRVEIEDLEEELSVDLINGYDIDDVDTLGGLIFSHLGRIPAKGEVIQYGHGVKFEILSADARRIRKVKVTHPPVACDA